MSKKTSDNPRISPQERGLIKGAIRRVFGRSALRQQAIEKTRIQYVDPTRKRVTKWSQCPMCEQPVPSYLLEVDHILPVIPLDSSLEEMAWDVLIDNLWCVTDNLRAICKSCHLTKTKEEDKIRRVNKKARGVK